MLFGEFLIQAGAVREDHVLTALERQEQRRPSLPRLAVALGLLSPRAALQLLDRARAGGRGFLELAEAEGLLKAEQALELAAKHQAAAPQIGALLLEMGALSREELQDHLKEYFRRLR
jgi:hypothetical protein